MDYSGDLGHRLEQLLVIHEAGAVGRFQVFKSFFN